MESPPITFDQLPAAVSELGRKVDDLTGLIKTMTGQQVPAADRWFSIEELSSYLPGKPAITTLYGKVQRGEIPFKRMGKRLAFLQSEIDTWLKSQHHRTQVETDIAAIQYPFFKKKNRA